MLRHRKTKERLFVSHEENGNIYLECDILIDGELTGVIPLEDVEECEDISTMEEKRYLFPITLSGFGKTPEEAWQDAVEGFCLDSGDCDTYMIEEDDDGSDVAEETVKECVIENGQFSYILRVDCKEISFQGMDCAEYFAEHYRNLGYDVKRIDTYQ